MSNLADMMRETASENVRLKQEILSLRSALNKYGAHLNSCEKRRIEFHLSDRCSCGFEKATE